MAKKLGVVVAAILLIGLGLYVSGYGGQLAFYAFYKLNAPTGEFDPSTTAPAPDYAQIKNWAALPEIDDPSDLVPEGVATAQGVQPVDTFFIHPTGFLVSSSWTSHMDPDSGTEENTHWMMANQASAYNGCCNLYAPRYREANIFAYFGGEPQRERVLGFAYADVKRSFEHYLTHFNQGRPFIIASHSQGSHHALRLLREEIDATALYEQFVAAYLLGSIVIPVAPSWFASMTRITPCSSAADLGCVVHWDTMPEGSEPLERPEPSLCTNPLSWRVDEERVSASHNSGAVVPAGVYNVESGKGDDVPTGQVFAALAKPIQGHTWAQCKQGSLFVANQEGGDFEAMGSGNLGSYHGLDYALFYMNIRENAILRSQRYLAHPKPIAGR